MSITLRKASVSDTAAICSVFFDAFRDHPANRRVFNPSLKQTQEYWSRSIDSELRNPNAHFVLVTDTASSPPGQVIGFAKWIEPRTASSPPPPPQHPWPQGADTAFADEFFGTLAKKHTEIMGDRPHWFLELLGVRTEYQKRGAGGILLRWGLQRADEAQVEAFLDSSPAGAALYAKHGFKTVDAVPFDDPGGEYVEKFMVRQPKKA
ncbi:acyl-CoA N-acyltransferase [Biscogniauxia mediterranea]|nr:acyl-CoA N-acyltransferase [Biscogniauxia mediterranea]